MDKSLLLNKKTILFTIIISAILIFYWLITITCQAVFTYCPADANTPGAKFNQFFGKYLVNSMHPLFGCSECSIEKYYSETITNFLKFIIAPILASYILAVLIMYALDKTRQKRKQKNH